MTRWTAHLSRLRIRTVVLLALLAVVLWAGYEVTWAYTARPKPTVDYAAKIEALTRANQPPGENAWPHLMEAARVMEQVLFPVPEEAPLDFDALLEGEAEPEQLETVYRVLAELETAGAFEALDAAGRCPNAVRPWPDDGAPLYGMTLPELEHLRTLGQACAARIHLAFEHGDPAEAVEPFDQALVIGRTLSHQASMIAQISGLAVANTALREMHRGLAARPPGATTARRLLAVLRDRTPLADPALGLEAERLAFLDLVQRTHAGDRLVPTATQRLAGSLSDATSDEGLPRFANLMALVLPSRGATVSNANAFFDGALGLSKLPRAKRATDPFAPEAFLASLGDRHFLLRNWAPAVGRFLDNYDAQHCFLNGTKLLIAVRGHRAETGACPPSLDALVPDRLDSLPADPFSAGGFVYRLTDDGCVLYSVGADGADDGGRAHDEPFRAFGEEGAGTDFILGRVP